MKKDLDYYLRLSYEIVIRRLEEEEGGGWLATIPDLPGCMSDGESVEEAVKNLEDAKRAWLATALEAGRDIPEPNREEFSGKFVVRIPKTLHRDLAARAKKEGVSLNQMVVYLLAHSLGRANNTGPIPGRTGLRASPPGINQKKGDEDSMGGDKERLAELTRELNRMVQSIVQKYKPLRIIVFGSVASGTVDEWSDIDLVVVKETDKPFYERLEEVAQIAQPNIAADILVYTPEEEEAMKDNLFFREEVLKKGRVVYDATQ